jgi:hypothetical protein
MMSFQSELMTLTAEAEAGAVPAASRFSSLLRAELSHHALLIGFVLVYCCVAMGVLAFTGQEVGTLGLSYLFAVIVPAVAVVVIRALGELLHHATSVRPFRWRGVAQGIRRSEIFSPAHVAAALLPIILLPVFTTAFTSFKLSIPALIPFAWDQALMEADKALHFGRHPWEWLQPVFGHPALTSLISYFYNLWAPLMMFVFYWQMFSLRNRPLRMQFMLSYVFAWAILGSLVALAFSSAGPCFYGDIVDGPNPYAGLMSYLNHADGSVKIWSLEAQSYLWENYLDKDAKIGGGISAFPSLHLCITTLIFLLCREIDRRLAWLSGAYVVIILIGSVHLAWHYALDGYLGILGAVLSWHLAGKLLRYTDEAPQSQGAEPAPAS